MRGRLIGCRVPRNSSRPTHVDSADFSPMWAAKLFCCNARVDLRPRIPARRMATPPFWLTVPRCARGEFRQFPPLHSQADYLAGSLLSTSAPLVGGTLEGLCDMQIPNRAKPPSDGAGINIPMRKYRYGPIR